MCVAVLLAALAWSAPPERVPIEPRARGAGGFVTESEEFWREVALASATGPLLFADHFE